MTEQWVKDAGADLYEMIRSGKGYSVDTFALLVSKWRPKREPDKFIDLACEWLPEDWQIDIELENGSGCAKLIDPDGNEVEVCDDDLTFDAMVLKRVNLARDRDGLGPIDMNGDAFVEI